MSPLKKALWRCLKVFLVVGNLGLIVWIWHDMHVSGYWIILVSLALFIALIPILTGKFIDFGRSILAPAIGMLWIYDLYHTIRFYMHIRGFMETVPTFDLAESILVGLLWYAVFLGNIFFFNVAEPKPKKIDRHT